VASAADIDGAGLRKIFTCGSSHGTSPTSSVHSDEQTSATTLNAGRRSARQSSRRISLQLRKQASTFVRTARCFRLKSKSDVEDEYPYGMSEASNRSSPDVMRMNAEPLMPTKRYKTLYHKRLILTCVILSLESTSWFTSPACCKSLCFMSQFAFIITTQVTIHHFPT